MEPSPMDEEAPAIPITSVLDDGSLSEVLARCWTVRDLCSFSLVSKRLNNIVKNSIEIWKRRLWLDFGMHLSVSPSLEAESFVEFARGVYTAEVEGSPRFQGILVNGGLDSDSEQGIVDMSYWADNIFNSRFGKRPFCSDASSNVDCLGLLLDGKVVEAEEYAIVRQRIEIRVLMLYMLYLMPQELGQTEEEEPSVQTLETARQRLNREKSDRFVEALFLQFADALENGHPSGELLIWEARNATEEGKARHRQDILFCARWLRGRNRRMLEGCIQLPGPLKTIVHLNHDYPIGGVLHSQITIVRTVRVARDGFLTCPVASGVVFAGVIDIPRLIAGMDLSSESKAVAGERVAKRLQTATQAHDCVVFNDMSSLDAVKREAECGTIPPIVDIKELRSHTCVLFRTSDPEIRATQQLDDNTVERPFIKWIPLFWFKFHTAAEARLVAQNIGIPWEGEVPMHDDDGIVRENHTAGRDGFQQELLEGVAANVLMVKLINQENLMDRLHDEHEYPNIDMTSCIPAGKVVQLPPEIQLLQPL